MKTKPNKPDAANLTITSRFHSEHQWRGVADLGRSAARHFYVISSKAFRSHSASQMG